MDDIIETHNVRLKDARDICYERIASRTPPAESQTAQEVIKNNDPHVSDTRTWLPKPDKSTAVTASSDGGRAYYI
jgi:hypothetical protein